MSDISDIVDAILTEVEAAVSGVTALTTVVHPDDRPDEDFPLATVLQTEYDVEPLDYLQENRVWTVSVVLWEEASKQSGDGLGTRETMQTKLEAIRDKIVADPTLGGTCDRAMCVTAIPESNPDASRIAGVFVVRAERVA